jgi:predicted anti-sigma-YlaC factor YlaD
MSEHVTEELGAYTLGALDADDAAAVRRHLAECPACAAEHEALAPLPGLLAAAEGAYAATAEPLSPAFEERLLDAYARDGATRPRARRRSLRRRWLVGGGALAAGLAAIVLAVVLVGGGDDSAAPSGYDVTFRSTGSGDASGRAKLDSGTEGTTVHLLVEGLPRDEDAVYEVLCDAEAWTASAGTFRTDGDGRAYAILTTALRRSEYDAIRVVRRRGGRTVFVAPLS